MIRDRFNFNEISYDAALLIFPFLTGMFYEPFIHSTVAGISSAKIMLLCFIYFIPVLIGRMRDNDFRESSAFIRNCITAVLFSVTIYAYSNLVYLVFYKGPDLDRTDFVIFITGTVLLIMGPIAGVITRELSTDFRELPVDLILFLFTAGILPLFYFIIYGKEIFGTISGILLFAIITGLIIADTLFIIMLYFMFFMLKRLLIRAGIFDFISSGFRLLIPFLVSCILLFFNIHSNRVFTGSGGSHGSGAMAFTIFLYIISGVLPMRFFMMITPPVRYLNVLSGIVSAAVMIYFISIR